MANWLAAILQVSVWVFPRFGDVSQGQIDELGGRLVARKVPSILEHLAQLHMQIFNRIGGVDDLSHLRRITGNGSDLFPIADTGLRDSIAKRSAKRGFLAEAIAKAPGKKRPAATFSRLQDAAGAP